ncbi:MAG: TMEM175 family protein, partial [Chitinophagaceae bacterium]
MSETNQELKKEFELERMILFSDAVFAIGITLLVIEIKFPEIPAEATKDAIIEAFKPVYIRFFAFMLSFFFIGMMWSRHLKMFKYLRTYDDGLIMRNLIFIFFVVCFPFTVSGFSENVKDGHIFPIFFYLVNIWLVNVAHFCLCYYLFKQKKQLCIPGFEKEKKYMLITGGATSLILTITLSIMIIVSFVYPGELIPVISSIYLMPILLIISKRKLKKYKPLKPKD